MISLLPQRMNTTASTAVGASASAAAATNVSGLSSAEAQETITIQPSPPQRGVARQFSNDGSITSLSSADGFTSLSSLPKYVTLSDCLVGHNPLAIRRTMQRLTPQYLNSSATAASTTETASSSVVKADARLQQPIDDEEDEEDDEHVANKDAFKTSAHSATSAATSNVSASDSNDNEDDDDDVPHDDWLDALAPVNSNWSMDDAPPHVIQLSLLRKIVSAGGISQDDDLYYSTHSNNTGSGSGNNMPPEAYRGLAWRVLLGYLPTDTSTWTQTLQEHREWYTQTVQRVFMDTTDVYDEAHDLLPLNGKASNSRLPGRSRSSGSASTATNTGNNKPSPPRKSQSTGSTGNGKNAIPPAIRAHWQNVKALDVNVLERLVRDLNALVMTVEPAGASGAAGATPIPFPPTNTSITTRDEKESPVHTDDSAEAEATGTISDVVTNGNRINDSNSTQRQHLDDFCDSAMLLDEIRKDVVRTLPDLSFFLEPTRNLGRRRYAALERILFCWSKYNTAQSKSTSAASTASAAANNVRYVQGMNEIAGILYYVLATDPHPEWAVWAEADTYWLLHKLLGEMSDVFVSNLDGHSTGIQGRIQEMQALLARHDPEVMEHFVESGIEAAFYAIRWWTTLLSREFLFPDTIRLWDGMFASTHKDNFLRHVCVCMVMTMRDKLLKGDFATCLKWLHSYPSTNIERLLESSRALWVYESQISVACHRGGLTLHQALTAIESPPALIMAFGFVNGTPPIVAAQPSANRLLQSNSQSQQAVASVRNAAQGMLGRARGLYNKYSKEYTKKGSDGALATSPESSSTLPSKSLTGLASAAESAEKARLDEIDDIYLRAILET